MINARLLVSYLKLYKRCFTWCGKEGLERVAVSIVIQMYYAIIDISNSHTLFIFLSVFVFSCNSISVSSKKLVFNYNNVNNQLYPGEKNLGFFAMFLLNDFRK